MISLGGSQPLDRMPLAVAELAFGELAIQMERVVFAMSEELFLDQLSFGTCESLLLVEKIVNHGLRPNQIIQIDCLWT